MKDSVDPDVWALQKYYVYIFFYISGTGTNACYMESLERVGTWDGDMNEPKQVCY